MSGELLLFPPAVVSMWVKGSSFTRCLNKKLGMLFFIFFFSGKCDFSFGLAAVLVSSKIDMTCEVMPWKWILKMCAWMWDTFTDPRSWRIRPVAAVGYEEAAAVDEGWFASIKDGKGHLPVSLWKATHSQSPELLRSAEPKALLIALTTNEIGCSTPNTTNILFTLNQRIRLACTSVLSPPVTIHMCRAASSKQRSIKKKKMRE